MWQLDNDKKETEEVVDSMLYLCLLIVGLVISLVVSLILSETRHCRDDCVVCHINRKLKRLFFNLKEYGCIIMRLASNGVVTYFMYALIKSVGEVLKSEKDRIYGSKSYVTPLEGIVWVLSCACEIVLEVFNIQLELLFGHIDLSFSMCPPDKPIPYIEAIEGVLLTICLLSVVYVLGGLWFEQARMMQDLEERRERRERNEMRDIVGESLHRSGRAPTMDPDTFNRIQELWTSWFPRDEINWCVCENKVCKCDALGYKKEVNLFFLKCKNNQEFFSSMIQKYNEKTCPICLEGMFIDKMEETDLYMTECGHKFHYDCFENYYCSFNGYKTKFRIPCPVCRKFGEGCKLLDLGNKNKNHSNNNEPRHCPDE